MMIITYSNYINQQTVSRPQAVALLLQPDSDSYRWSDGWPVFFTHWGPGEPTNHKGEGCVSMHAPSHFIQGTWNDTACDDAKPYICKITKGKAEKRCWQTSVKLFKSTTNVCLDSLCRKASGDAGSGWWEVFARLVDVRTSLLFCI